MYSLKGLDHIHGEEHGHAKREGSSHREDHWRRDTTGHAVTLNDLLAITVTVRSQSKDQNYLNDLIFQTAYSNPSYIHLAHGFMLVIPINQMKLTATDVHMALSGDSQRVGLSHGRQ